MTYWAKILLMGVFAIMGVMVITAVIHLIAPYLGVLIIGSLVFWFLWSAGNLDPPAQSDDPE